MLRVSKCRKVSALFNFPSQFILSILNTDSCQNSCYTNCPDTPDYIAAQSSSASDCATANAYDKGHTIVPDTWKTMDFHNDVHPTSTSAGSDAAPTSTGAKILDTHKESAQPSKGAANVKATGSWLALVGLGIGAFF